MKKKKDILADEKMHSLPFVMPDGYVQSLENRIHERIYREPSPMSVFLLKAKAPAMLALTFAVIFGMGYGMLRLTGTADKSTESTDGIPQMLENCHLSSTFIEDYYDEISSETILSQSQSTIEMTAELESEIINTITLDDILEQ